MRSALTIAKALADENRLRLLLALSGRELCVCQVTELLGLAPSSVSRHLALLHQAGLVETRKAGRWVYCRQAGRGAPAAARQALAWARAALVTSPVIRADRRRLTAILKCDPAELCRRQCRP